MIPHFIPSRVKSRTQDNNFFVKALLIAVIAAVVLRLFVMETILVDGPSMEPSLYTNERLIVDKLSYRFRQPRRNEVVIAEFDGRAGHFVKRVIGLPGETVEIREGLVYIDGEPYAQDYYGDGLRRRDMEPVLVPEGHVFIMGDNRDNSTDSADLGPVPYQDLRGRAVWIIWPLDRFGSIPSKRN